MLFRVNGREQNIGELNVIIIVVDETLQEVMTKGEEDDIDFETMDTKCR